MVNLSIWDTIPRSLDAGFDLLGRLDRNWIWVAKKGDDIVGVLVASPAHGAAMIWRLAVTEDASPVCVLRLLRTFLRDIRRRGCVGYLTLVQPEQAHLRKIVEKFGGNVTGGFTMMASKIPEEVK